MRRAALKGMQQIQPSLPFGGTRLQLQGNHFFPLNHRSKQFSSLSLPVCIRDTSHVPSEHQPSLVHGHKCEQIPSPWQRMGMLGQLEPWSSSYRLKLPCLWSAFKAQLQSTWRNDFKDAFWGLRSTESKTHFHKAAQSEISADCIFLRSGLVSDSLSTSSSLAVRRLEDRT